MATALEFPKSPHTPPPQKDEQTMGPVWASPQFNKLSMAEKGKAITTELEEEEENLQALIAKIKAQRKMFPKSIWR